MILCTTPKSHITSSVSLCLGGVSETDGRRPGILVLVNDADWELEGTGEYILEEGDEIAFISTLHGG
jgi:hypothetical protein